MHLIWHHYLHITHLFLKTENDYFIFWLCHFFAHCHINHRLIFWTAHLYKLHVSCTKYYIFINFEIEFSWENGSKLYVHSFKAMWKFWIFFLLWYQTWSLYFSQHVLINLVSKRNSNDVSVLPLQFKMIKNCDFHSFLSDKDEVRSISSLDDHSEEGSSSTDLKHEQDDEKEEEVSSNHFF